jgi:hypothetical protein
MDGFISHVFNFSKNVMKRTFSMKIHNKPVVLSLQNISAQQSKPSKGTIVYMCGGPGLPCS